METDSVQDSTLQTFLEVTANVIGIATLHLETIDQLKSYLFSVYSSKNADKAIELLPELNYIVSLFQRKSVLLPEFLSRLEQKCKNSPSDEEIELSYDSGIQNEPISKENLIKKVVGAVLTNHVDFPNKSGRKRACKKIAKLLRQNDNPSAEHYLDELRRRFSIDTEDEFKKYVKMIWDDLTIEKGSVPNYFERKSKEKYDAQVKKAVRILKDVLEEQSLDHTLDSEIRRAENYVHVVCYMSCRESDWKSSGQKGLPPDHRAIIRLKEENESDMLVAFVHKLVRLATSSNCLVRIEEEKKNDFETSQPKTVPKGAHEGMNWSILLKSAPVHMFSLLGATFKFGLEMLPSLVKNPKMHRLIIGFDDFLGGIMSSHPYLLSFGISAAYIAGVSIWNALKCWRNERSKKRAGKNTMDALITTVVANLAGFGVAAMVTPVTAPISIVLLITAGNGIGTSFLLQPIVDRLTQWLFKLPKDEALEKAFNILGVDKNATDEEIRRAYRHRMRDNHEDKLTQSGSSREDIEEGMRKIDEIRQALGYIALEREKLAKNANEFSFVDRVISLIENVRIKFAKKNDDNEKKVIRALMQIEYV